MNFNELKVGMSVEFIKEITTEDVVKFAEISGDRNPIHLDEEYAKESIFKGRIVHGMLAGALFSTTIASELPGPGSIYLNQTLNFMKPIYHNSEVRVVVEVDRLKPEKKVVFLNTKCWVKEDLVIDGSAVVKCLE